jgi:predicted acylesterase/phospholipase RssA
MGLLGLACSGGGIRSATFNLGVLQGLARLGLLRRLDYLSTVSGGGYIGSWLSAWVYRAKGGILEVERHLSQGHSGPRATPADGSAAGASAKDEQ